MYTLIICVYYVSILCKHIHVLRVLAVEMLAWEYWHVLVIGYDFTNALPTYHVPSANSLEESAIHQ